MMTVKNTLVKEIASMDLLCDSCGEEIKTGEPFYFDSDSGKVYCISCFESL